MADNITRERFFVIMVIAALFLVLSFLSGILYVILLGPQYGDRYSNIFFMVSFTLIFFSLVYLYHIWIGRIENGKEE